MQKLAFLTEFAERHSLLFQCRTSQDGLPECYIYTRDMRYRYAFARWWDANGPFVLWVLINPGMGDTEMRPRPTVERCIGWTRKWEAGGMAFANLFAARHNKPSGLRSVIDPVGPYNDEVLRTLSEAAYRTVAAWGGSGRLLKGRSAVVTPFLAGSVCLGLTKSGQPRHPLYVRGGAEVMPWPPASTPVADKVGE